ncbi:MAG: NfeD family protein [Planctomycetia bacterium]|nr:NfeD family protein [Planctomycetia bacterium]
MNNELLVLILFAAALFFAVLEIFVPSFGILTVLAAASLIWSIVLAFSINQIAGFIYLCAMVVFIPIVLSLVLKIIPKTKFGKRFFLEKDPETPEADDPIREEFRTLIGKEGSAASIMMPSGKVKINGVLYEAVSETGALDPGTPVVVLRNEAATLIVAKKM